jgi:hypothetical protein
MKIFKAIGLGLVAGVVVGGIMAYRRSKKVQEKVDEVFDEEFVNNVVEKTTENLKDINNQVQEDIQKSFDELAKTKNDVLNNISERHAKLDEEIRKMEESQIKTTQTTDEIKEEAKAAVAEVVGQDENESDKEHREKIEKLQAETEKQLDDLLNDLSK